MNETPRTVIPFPVKGQAPRRAGIRHAATLPGFRVCTGEPRKITELWRETVDEALELDWTAPLIIEFDDPKASSNRRDIHLRFVEHEGKRWKVRWMDRTRTPGKKTYGLTRG